LANKAAEAAKRKSRRRDERAPYCARRMHRRESAEYVDKVTHRRGGGHVRKRTSSNEACGE
jgi:hypothetical protein